MALAMRLLELFISRAYYCFWIDISNKNVFSDWLLLACVFPNGWMGALIWCAKLLARFLCSVSNAYSSLPRLKRLPLMTCDKVSVLMHQHKKTCSAGKFEAFSRILHCEIPLQW